MHYHGLSGFRIVVRRINLSWELDDAVVDLRLVGDKGCNQTYDAP